MREIKEWVKPSQEKSLKNIAGIQFGVIEQKDDHCYKHRIDFVNNYERFPSGKTQWTGCNNCKHEAYEAHLEKIRFKEHKENIITKHQEQQKEVFTPVFKKSAGFRKNA